jgi:probable HAF family extracellular repeat protein
VIAIFVAVPGLFAQRAAQTYAIVDLGTLGGDRSEATDVNNLGEVVGSAATAAGTVHAFLYRAGNMADLGTLVGGTTSRASAISDAGIVVGTSGINAYGPMFREFDHAFVWYDGAMRPLGALYCPCTFNTRHGTSRAFALNSSARIVGESLTNRATFTHAFVWQSTGMQDLIAEEDGASNSTAYDINEVGDIAGEIDGRAFLARFGVLQELGVLAGDVRSRARAVNDRGQVAGDSIGSDGSSHAFLWEPGGLRALGSLPGDAASEARAINMSGHVVGRSGPADFSASRAVLWRDGLAIDLSQRLASGGWTLLAANGINDVGQIVGVGMRAGQRRAFLLTPQ